MLVYKVRKYHYKNFKLYVIDTYITDMLKRVLLLLFKHEKTISAAKESTL